MTGPAAPPASEPAPAPGRAHAWLDRADRRRPGGAPASTSRQATAWLAVRVAGGLLAAIGVTAVAIRLTAAAATRRWLDYPFTGVPTRAGEAAAIFGHNGRALLGAFGLLLIAQLAARGRTAAGAGRVRVQGAVRAGGEVLLGALITANVLMVGAGLGAYGLRMALAMLPHGPVELAAFGLALALYLQGRRRPLPARHMVTAGGASVLLLAVAATLETFVAL